MKKILKATLVLLLAASQLKAQNRKIVFDTLTLEAACKKAALTNQLVFVDCYTTWCIPCKHMEANVFTVDSVADYFNKTFINLKMDMEKGEAVALGKKYRIGAYPSYLLIDKDGNLVYKFVGGMLAGEFMAKVKGGQNPFNEVAILNGLYDEGDRSPALMRRYIQQKIRLMEIAPAKALNADYMKQLSAADKTLPENWFLFGENRYALYLSEAGSGNFDYLANHWKEFTVHISKDTIDKKLGAVYRKTMGVYLSGAYKSHLNDNYKVADMAKYRKQIAATQMPDKDQLLTWMDISEAVVNKQYNQATQLLADHVDKFSEANQHVVFDFIFGLLSVKGYKYEGFGVIADKIEKTSTNPYLIHSCEQYKQKELEARAK
ncbi:Thioredoxin-like [Filimonas lacunae]|uniref:Thioredoxin-like n=1 Tax=Filimonas lacunae TaxID=477680 RepID=A0A173MD59_9BACT|nr:thioredoxin family protein [Filimonas lacunae]BAV05381.1 disulphide-isomerase [Filimonas lacunae]SIT21595.1 Thioredoxin-like [Filimonas lacunae]